MKWNIIAMLAPLFSAEHSEIKSSFTTLIKNTFSFVRVKLVMMLAMNVKTALPVQKDPILMMTVFRVILG